MDYQHMSKKDQLYKLNARAQDLEQELFKVRLERDEWAALKTAGFNDGDKDMESHFKVLGEVVRMVEVRLGVVRDMSEQLKAEIDTKN